MCICERVLWIFPHCHQVTSLAAAVRAPISVHSHQHPTSLLLATHLLLQLPAYLCDCDPLDHGTHDTPGTHTIGCLPSL